MGHENAPMSWLFLVGVIGLGLYGLIVILIGALLYALAVTETLSPADQVRLQRFED